MTGKSSGGASGKRLCGRCLCGAVAFSIPADGAENLSACHCSQCRRWSGHVWASVNAPLEGLQIEDGEGALKWHRASDVARRGFCGICGSSLFWHAEGVEEYKHRIAVALGALDAPTGLRLEEHIFVAHKGDYYDIADGLPQKATE